MSHIGKYLVIIGILVTIAGVIIWLSGNKLGWFGNLPGDIRVEKENVRFYTPLASMLLLSLAISIVIWLVRKFFS